MESKTAEDSNPDLTKSLKNPAIQINFYQIMTCGVLNLNQVRRILHRKREEDKVV